MLVEGKPKDPSTQYFLFLVLTTIALMAFGSETSNIMFSALCGTSRGGGCFKCEIGVASVAPASQLVHLLSKWTTGWRATCFDGEGEAPGNVQA